MRAKKYPARSGPGVHEEKSNQIPIAVSSPEDVDKWLWWQVSWLSAAILAPFPFRRHPWLGGTVGARA